MYIVSFPYYLEKIKTNQLIRRKDNQYICLPMSVNYIPARDKESLLSLNLQPLLHFISRGNYFYNFELNLSVHEHNKNNHMLKLYILKKFIMSTYSFLTGLTWDQIDDFLQKGRIIGNPGVIQ